VLDYTKVSRRFSDTWVNGLVFTGTFSPETRETSIFFMVTTMVYCRFFLNPMTGMGDLPPVNARRVYYGSHDPFAPIQIEW